MIETLTISAAASAFAVTLLGSILKRWIYPKFGKFGVQVSIFILAAIAAWFVIYGQHIANLMTLATGALAIFSLSVTFYEVLLSRIDFFKVTTGNVEAARAQAATNTI